MKHSHYSSAFKALFARPGAAGVFLLLSTASLFSQEVPPPPVQTAGPNQIQSATQTLSPESLKELLAPIALYPDALIALILPASTVPSDVVLASRFVAANGDPQQIPNQAWDNSVQSLASYPEVVTWMDQNLEWTTSLGQAFLVQPTDVMNAIQQLRAEAQAAGNLVNTPQQVVVREKTIIRIVPAEPEYLYVPQYDPEIVYVQPYAPDYGPLVTFGLGFAVGSWLNYDFDWNRHEIYRGDWQPGWDYGRYGNGGNNGGGNNVNNVNVVNINQNTAQPWQPGARSRQQVARQQQNFQRANSNLARNAQTSPGIAVATADNASQAGRHVPQPTRANFGNRGNGGKHNAATSQQPGAPVSLPVTDKTNRPEPTTPPNVAGQQGKPVRNSGKTDAGQNANKQTSGKNAPQTLPATVLPPQNSAPSAQIGSVPQTPPANKKQQGANVGNSDRVPRPSQAPIVDQNGRTQPAATQVSPVGKHTGSHVSTPSPQQAAPVGNTTATAPSGKNSGHKSSSSGFPVTQSPAPQVAPGNSSQHPKSAPQVSSFQQPSQSKKHSSENKVSAPASQQPKAQSQQQKAPSQPKAQPQQQKAPPQPKVQQQQQKAPPQPKVQQQQQKAPPQPKVQQQQQKAPSQPKVQQQQQKAPSQPKVQQQQQKAPSQPKVQQQQQKAAPTHSSAPAAKKTDKKKDN